ncbi:Apolipoprotein N-acyltransferase [Hyphomicrobium sulfonivorans]|uniref:Apolipoprotein N-acyltransferase n=1 Tax=Hyphomicrobium sulfonivorans TaxID=121290 RepID=A0A120CV08_HYPSL|nr:apolipoprotein N-acyltransferase [Hyphomicrobium sulfonivorans]KWT67064.1 Apolipoprotein N-acyltransferase [Hyphomicrobium sulfonivorans]
MASGQTRRGSGASGLPVRIVGALGWVAASVADLRGWRRAALLLVVGAISALAMAPFHVAAVLFITLPILVWSIDGVQPPQPGASIARWRLFRSAAAVGWWFGFGYFLVGLFWIGEAFLVEAEKFAWLLPFAVVMLPAGLALFMAAATGFARLLWGGGIARVLMLAVALGVTEWLRGHILTGFPWNVIGYALTWPAPLMQSASVLGIYGLTLLAVVIFAAPLVLIADAAKAVEPSPSATAASAGRSVNLISARAILAALAIAVGPIAVLHAVGTWRLADAPPAMLEGVRVRIVQASVPQRDKWRQDKQRQIFDDQLSLSLTGPTGRVDNLAGITHLIWPEAAMPFLPLEHPEALEAIGFMLPDTLHLLSGALRLARPEGGAELPRHGAAAREGFNSLMVFDGHGSLYALYDKIHLVPFGEYLPMQWLLESIGLEQLTRWRGGFSAGQQPRPLLQVPGLPPVSGLICYEAIFPAEVVQGATRPGLLVNVTNDGWFGDTTGPWQHFHQTRVRAVEEGLPIIRAANNGVSAVIDPQGRVVAMLGLNMRGVLDSDVPKAAASPIYARYGDGIFALLAALGFGVALMLRFPKR